MGDLQPALGECVESWAFRRILLSFLAGGRECSENAEKEAVSWWGVGPQCRTHPRSDGTAFDQTRRPGGPPLWGPTRDAQNGFGGESMRNRTGNARPAPHSITRCMCVAPATKFCEPARAGMTSGISATGRFAKFGGRVYGRALLLYPPPYQPCALEGRSPLPLPWFLFSLCSLRVVLGRLYSSLPQVVCAMPSP